MKRLEVLDHHFGLLRDVVRMQPHEARERLGRLLALDVLVLGTFLEQPVVACIGRVVLQHVEDEPFLDRLAHGVAVEGSPSRPKTAKVSCFGVAVKAKKLTFSCRARFAILREDVSFHAPALPHAPAVARLRQLFAAEHAFRRWSRSPPDCELWASSMMTATRVGDALGPECIVFLALLGQL